MIHRIDNGSIYCYYYCIQIPCTYFNFIHVIVRKYFFSFPNCYDKLHTYENAAVVIFQCNAGRISVLSSPLLFLQQLPQEELKECALRFERALVIFLLKITGFIQFSAIFWVFLIKFPCFNGDTLFPAGYSSVWPCFECL